MKRNEFSLCARLWAMTLAILIGLSGCLSSEDEPAADISPQDELLYDNQVTGSVGDGPVVGAAMRVRQNDGQIVAEFESDALAGYNIVVRTKGKYYPLSIDARNGVDLVTNTTPDFVLLGAVLEPGKNSTANVNPFSTIAVEAANDMPGGFSKENVNRAQAFVVEKLGSGLSLLATSGPMNTQIDSSNVTEIVKASETLGELIRRVRDLQLVFNRPSSGDAVVRALGSDLVDGVVDGRGGSRTDPRVAAFAIIAGVQVMLESMQNELHVNGQDATSRLAAAILQVSGTMVLDLGEMPTTQSMIDASRIGLDAILAVTTNEKLQGLRDATDLIQAGMTANQVKPLIPDDYRTTLDNAVITIAGSDDGAIATINEVSRNGGAVSDTGPANTAPTISGTPQTTVETGTAYAFQPQASDPDGDTLTFGISGQPVWASFDTQTGRLSGTPVTGDAGSYGNIVISVSDGEFAASLPAFTITVTASEVNNPPTISGTPTAEVGANTAYSFRPSASDADGDTLSFGIVNKPVWAYFNSQTGELSGTPTDADVGVYSDIRITVSDGIDEAELGSFSITVNAASLGSVTLTWVPPTENDDGTPLTDLAGYKFYWGTTPGVYPNSVMLDNPGLTSYVVENLAPGTYEFVATSLNSDGVESAYSNPATKMVQ